LPSAVSMTALASWLSSFMADPPGCEAPDFISRYSADHAKIPGVR
jgi:hypothetical protein